MPSQQYSRGNTPIPAPGNNAEKGSEEMNSDLGSNYSDTEEVHPMALEYMNNYLRITAQMNSLYDVINTYHFLMSSRLGHANQTVVRLNDLMSTLRHQQEVLAEARQLAQTGGIEEARHLVSEIDRAITVCQDTVSRFQATVNEVHGMTEQGNETGLSGAQLQSLPTTHISIQQVEVGTRCNVCLMDYIEGETVCRLSCSHLYHSHCITRWLTTKTTCPTCRRNLQEESAD